MAYAFLNALPRLGAGNPKGLSFYEEEGFIEGAGRQPWLVVDRYLVPRGRRPVVPPHITQVPEACRIFRGNAHHVEGGKVNGSVIQADHFTRYLGQAALKQLQDWAAQFAEEYLTEARAT